MFNAPWPLPSGGGVNGSSGFWSSGIVNYELRAASFELGMRARSSQLRLQLSNCIYRMLSALRTCSIIACFGAISESETECRSSRSQWATGAIAKRGMDAAELSLGGEVSFLSLRRSLWVWAGFSPRRAPWAALFQFAAIRVGGFAGGRGKLPNFDLAFTGRRLLRWEPWAAGSEGRGTSWLRLSREHSERLGRWLASIRRYWRSRLRRRGHHRQWCMWRLPDCGRHEIQG